MFSPGGYLPPIIIMSMLFIATFLYPISTNKSPSLLLAQETCFVDV